ncbi:hypothetical protein BR1R5_21500 [Pseudomonas sp. BR1R-5]|nr:hypothetical protein BR1R5_21500 [Pseudomonas sp. BR1R-5]
MNRITEAYAYSQTDCHRCQGAYYKWNKHPNHPLDKNCPVHSKDASHDKTSNNKIKEVGILHQHFCGINSGATEKAVVNQNRGEQEAQDRTAAYVSEQRQSLTHLAEEHAHGHDDR